MRFAEGKKRPSTAVKRVATQRLTVDERGRVVYHYKRPFRDGSTHVVLEPLEFIARLAALVPRLLARKLANRHAGLAGAAGARGARATGRGGGGFEIGLMIGLLN